MKLKSKLKALLDVTMCNSCIVYTSKDRIRVELNEKNMIVFRDVSIKTGIPNVTGHFYDVTFVNVPNTDNFIKVGEQQ